MASNSQLSFPSKGISFSYRSDIERASQNQEVALYLGMSIQKNPEFNVDLITEKLSKVPKYLQLAYASSKDYSWNKEISLFIMNYQDLIGNLLVETEDLVNTTLDSLQCHVTAIEMTQVGKFELAAKMLKIGSENSEKMTQIFQRMLTGTETLCQSSKGTLLTLENEEKQYKGKHIGDTLSLSEAIKNFQLTKNAGSKGDIARTALTLTLKIMEKVETTLSDTKSFWTSFQTKCNQLVNAQTPNEIVHKDERIKEIEQSGLNWLTLGNVFNLALSKLDLPHQAIGNVLSNLPSSSEAKLVGEHLMKELVEDSDGI